MICLKEAILINFGCFKDKSIQFDDRIQVIYGDNEAGKSTIQLFLRLMIYGISGTRKDGRGIKERERCIPWGEKSAEGILRLEHNGRSIEIYRKFGKTASGDKTEILDRNTGDTLKEYDAKFLGEQLIGVPESIFEKTFWLRQDGAFIGGVDAEISSRLLNLIDTGDEEISADEVIAELEAERRKLKAKDRRSNPGIMDVLWNTREEKVQEKYQLSSESKQRESEQERLIKGKKRLLEIEKELESLREIGDKKKKLIAIENDRKKLEQAEKILELAKQAESREAYIRFGTLSEELVAEAENLKNNIETLDQSVSIGYDNTEIEKSISDVKNAEKQGRVKMITGGVLLVLSAFCLMFTGILRIVLPVIFIAGALYFIISGISKERSSREELIKLFNEKNQAEKNKERNELERKIIKDKLDAILSKYHSASYKELYDGYMQCTQARLEAESYRKTFESILDGENIDDLSARVREVVENSGIDNEIAGLDIDAIEQKLKAEQLDVLSGIKETEGKLSYVYNGGKSPADVETEIRQIDEQICEAEKKLRAIELADEVFKNVYEIRKSDFTPRVNEKVNYYLNQLTGGKYKDVRVSDEYKLKISLENSNLYEAEYFSQGTYEQIYFALRLALCSLIGQGGEPVFLDDFLMAYDDTRAKNTVKILNDIAKERQVVLFTCHQRDIKSATDLNIPIFQIEEENNNGNRD